MLARKLSCSALLFLILFFVFTILLEDKLSNFLTKVLKANEKVATIIAILIISFLSANVPSIVQMIFQALLTCFRN